MHAKSEWKSIIINGIKCIDRKSFYVETFREKKRMK